MISINGENASISDALRIDYLNGEKELDWDVISEDFEVSDISYFLSILLAFVLISPMFSMVINAVGRIFNMLVLYLVAPPLIATMPLDDGEKFKQWTTAFIVQTFNIFGTLISMYLLTIMVPVIFSENLKFFDNGLLNLAAKIIMFAGIAFTADGASDLLGGILANNAGMQSVMAGSVAKQAGFGGAGSAVRAAAGAAKAAATSSANPVAALVKRGWAETGGRYANMMNQFTKAGSGGVGKDGSKPIDDVGKSAV